MYSGGSGTQSDPYLIATPQDLSDIRNNLTAYFKLINDIDLEGTSQDPFTAIGVAPINTSFRGHVDGNGKVVEGFNLNISGINKGMFGYVSAATFKDLGIVSATETTDNANNCGVLVGSMRDGTTIDRCYATGVFKLGSSSSNQVGGLVGQSESSTDRIRNCYTDVELRGDEGLGGIIANVASPGDIVQNCYAAGDIECTDLAGGICIDGYAENCAAVMDALTAFGAQNSFYRIGFSSLTNNFANSAMTLPRTPTSDADGRDGEDKTLTELRQRSTYETGLGWDFADTWQIESGQFPTLRVFNRIALDPYFFGSNF